MESSLTPFVIMFAALLGTLISIAFNLKRIADHLDRIKPKE